MDAEDIQGKKYPGFGRCIYCNSDGGKDGLHEEHLVPFCLGGNAVIENASCTACEKITSYLEGYLGRRIFYELRIHTDVQTRRPKDRPTHLKATIQVAGVLETREFPAKEQPFAVALPVWAGPGIIIERLPTMAFEQEGKFFFYYVPPALQAEQPFGQFVVDARSNTKTFARAMMKIAYCHAVARFGLDGFRKLFTRQIILGHYPYVSHFIGCNSRTPPKPETDNQMHTIQHGDLRVGRLKLLIMGVRLFASSGFQDKGLPTYWAVVGALPLSRQAA